MKIIGSILLLFCCGSCSEDSSDKQIKSEVEQLLDNWHKHAADAEYEPYMAAMDEESVFIGTDISENWDKVAFEDFSEEIFARGKAWSFKALERNIYLSENRQIAWFDEILTTWMGSCRGSGVLERSDGKWKIKQYVLSVAIPNEDIQQVIKIKQKNDSLFLSRFNNTVKRAY